MSQQPQNWREHAPLILTRLLGLKKDVRDLQDALENVVVGAPSDQEHKQWQQEKLLMPEQLRYLTEHPLIHAATKIKNQSAAVAQLAQLLGVEMPAGGLPTTADSSFSTAADPRRSPSVNFVGVGMPGMPGMPGTPQPQSQPQDPRLANRTATRPATDPRIRTPSTPGTPLAQPAVDPRKRARTLDETESETNKRMSTMFPALPEIRNQEIRDLVFTHRSVASSNAINTGKFGNVHLAFVGQSVLDLCITLMVTTYFPDRDVSFLNLCKSRVVPTTEIYKWCSDYGLDKQLIRLDTGNDDYYDTMVELFKAYIGGLYQEDRCQLTRTKAWLDALLAPLVAAYNEDDPAFRPQPQMYPGMAPGVMPPHMNHSNMPSPGPNGANGPSFEPSMRGLTRDQKMTMDSMMNLSVEATRPMKERLYLQVSLAFIPQYETYFSDVGFPPRPPCFKVAVLVNGDVIGIGEAVTLKEAGSRAAWCALNLNWNKLDRYRRIAQDIKRKVIPKPTPVTIPVVDQIRSGFLEGGSAPFTVSGY